MVTGRTHCVQSVSTVCQNTKQVVSVCTPQGESPVVRLLELLLGFLQKHINSNTCAFGVTLCRRICSLRHSDTQYDPGAKTLQLLLQSEYLVSIAFARS